MEALAKNDIRVTWQLINQGDAAFSGSLEDRLFLTLKPDGHPTDATKQVFEHVLDENNVGYDATPVAVHLTPPPDLEVVSVMAPTTALAGHLLEITYRVTNAGAQATSARVSNRTQASVSLRRMARSSTRWPFNGLARRRSSRRSI